MRVVEAVTTAGRSVLIAGSTVVIAVLGLFLTGLSYMQGVALSASIAVLVVMLASVTLLPALLAMLGQKVNRWHIPCLGRAPGAEREQGKELLAARWSHAVQRRPWTAAIVVDGGPARARGPGPGHATGLSRRRQRSAGHDDPPGL